jgi:peptide/nickel transport system ATP-binding protein
MAAEPRPAPGPPADDARPVVLEVDDLHVRFAVRRASRASGGGRQRATVVRAVDGVSFALRRGEMVALVGESGCGKTTTIHALLRLVDADRGAVRLDGRDVTDLSQRALRPLRRRIQIVYQDPYESLDPRFRVRRTVEEPLLVHRVGGSAAERRELVAEALRRVELNPEQVLDRFPHELSGGQRQRVALAAALVLKPDVLIADEPVSMLDVSVRAGVLQLLSELRAGGLGILMVTHDLSTAAKFADRIAVMYLGRIVEEGPARQVIEDPRHPYTRALLSVVPRRDPRKRHQPQIIRGETPDPAHVPPGCRFHPRCPVAFEACPLNDPRLLPIRGERDHSAACLRVEAA